MASTVDYGTGQFGARLPKEFRDYGRVEVLLSNNGELQQQQKATWHEAYIVDIEETISENDSGLVLATLVMAVSDEKPELTLSEMKNVKKVPLEQVRLNPTSISDHFSELDMVEVRVILETKLIVWKEAQIKKIRGDFFAVQFNAISGEDSQEQSNGGLNVDIVSKEDVRLPSSVIPFSSVAHNFYRFEIPFPAALLKEFDNDLEWLANFELHREFKTHLNHIAVYFNRQQRALVCLGFSPSVAEKAFFQAKALESSKLLISFHFHRLFDIYSINVGLEKSLAAAKEPKNFQLTLKIDERLVGLAIGKSGQNIQKARNISGIKLVEYDEDLKAFIIQADTAELCQKAAAIVNFNELVMLFDYKEYKNFFEDRALIQEIVSLSQMYYVHIDTIRETEINPKQYKIKLIGTIESVEAFQFLLAYQIDEWKEIVALKIQVAELYKKIMNAQGKGSGSSISIRVSASGSVLSSSPMSSGQQAGWASPKNFAEAVKAGMH